jgi:hypothetical protein
VTGLEVEPKNFEEAKQLAPAKRCSVCGQKKATHTVSFTAAKTGEANASVVAQIRQAPVCEPCGTRLYTALRKAIKA